MKLTVALFTLVVVCCAKTLAQEYDDHQRIPFPPVTKLVTISPVIFTMPGGLHEVTEITQEHIDLAKFAATEIGSEYTLNNVTRVQTQVVAGIIYHMDISVTKTKGSVQTSLDCEVKIYHSLNGKKTLTEFKCTRV